MDTTMTKAPQTLADFEPYSTAIDRLGQLQENLAETERRISAFREAEQAHATLSLDDLAGELIHSDFDVNASLTMPNKAELERLELNAQVIRRAIEKQLVEVGNQRGQASRAICEARRSAYLKNMDRCAKAVIEAGRAFEEQVRFFQQLEELDVTFTAILPPMPFRDFANARDRHSVIAYWLIEATQIGSVERSVIPPEWRHAWSGR